MSEAAKMEQIWQNQACLRHIFTTFHIYVGGMAQDDDGASTGESEGMDTDEEHLAPPGEEDEDETPGKVNS